MYTLGIFCRITPRFLTLVHVHQFGQNSVVTLPPLQVVEPIPCIIRKRNGGIMDHKEVIMLLRYKTFPKRVGYTTVLRVLRKV